MRAATNPQSLKTLLLITAIGALATAPLAAQGAGDRKLLTTQTGAPYVMILLDTSGSMNWAPKCTQAQYDTLIDDDHDSNGVCPAPAGKTPCVRTCNYVCATGDCPVPRDGDDPASKFRQAKEALYEVVKSTDNVHFGFATYNQNNLRLTGKQWLYNLNASQAGGFFTLGTEQFPATGSYEVVGTAYSTTAPLYGCDRGGTDGQIGCYASTNRAADTNDSWEMTKVRRLAKLGIDQSLTVVYYIRTGGQAYRVETMKPSGSQTLGASTLKIRMKVFKCTGSTASSPSNNCDAGGEYTAITNGDKEFTYTLVGPFAKWDYQVSRTSPQAGYDGFQFTAADSNSFCNGWDPNTDTSSDNYPTSGTTYNLRFPNTGVTYDPPGTANDGLFTVGDVLPLDWNNDNKVNVLNRLAPRLNGGDPASDPEAFGIATYFNDTMNSGQAYFRLKNENNRPLMPDGATPIAASMINIRTWYRGCASGNCTATQTGWDDIASVVDENWNCRKRYLIILSDGDETCSGNPCTIASTLKGDGFTTYIVAFGTNSTPGNKLDCIAANGGSGTPIYPQNKQDLINGLKNIFGEIIEATSAFASAAVPTVQTNILDKIYLSSFIPLNDESVWPGRLDSFLKPLPLDHGGLPDRAAKCAVGQQSECFAWDAGDSQPAWNSEAGYQPTGLLLQAPLASQFSRYNNATLKIGTAADQRRVFFGRPDNTDVGHRRYFRYPATNQEWLDLEYTWNITSGTALSTTRKSAISDIIEFTLKQKQATVTNPTTHLDEKVQYVMGDIFHSNPVVISPPNNFEFFTKDLYWNTPLCGQTLAQTRARGAQLSYSWYSNKNLCKRVVLSVGSNDGQMHFFDGGLMRDITPDDPTTTTVNERVPADCLLNVPSGSSSHAAGLYDEDGAAGSYDFGTGREIFSFIPQAMMPLVQQLSSATELTTQYGIDGTPRIADVFIDPVPTAGVPTCTQRVWRSVLLGSYREGGPGIFALDLTQPDTFDSDNIPRPLSGSPSYVPSCIDGGGGCGTFCASGDTTCTALPYPSLMWEFRDLNVNGTPADDDGNGIADFAESWSRPLVVRHPVCNGACDTASEPEDRWIAIFGGGLPEFPSNDSTETSGNWLYIVDIETGKLLYKRGGSGNGTTSPIAGAVASDVTGVDFNSDGVVDTLYFGTTGGYVYKVDLGDAPFQLSTTTGRIVGPVGDSKRFDPYQVFSTLGRPIYLEVNAVYIPKLRANALLFGTGMRWDLWNKSSIPGRFYAVVDQGWTDANRDGVLDPPCIGCPTPLTETRYPRIDYEDNASPTSTYLYGNSGNQLPGWYFALPNDDKLITEPITLSGVSIFTFFSPVITENNDGTCASGGESKIFVVNAVTTQGYAIPPGTTDRTRYTTATAFTTQPYVESSATKNPVPTSTGGTNADTWTTELSEINSDLRKLFPPGARFANYTLDIKTIRKDTGILFIAPVPVAIEAHSWKEF